MMIVDNCSLHINTRIIWGQCNRFPILCCRGTVINMCYKVEVTQESMRLSLIRQYIHCFLCPVYCLIIVIRPFLICSCC